MSNKKKELNVEELEQVNGGDMWDFDFGLHLNEALISYTKAYPNKIEPSQMVRNQEYFFYSDSQCYLVGKLITDYKPQPSTEWSCKIIVKEGNWNGTILDPGQDHGTMVIYGFHGYEIYSK